MAKNISPSERLLAEVKVWFREHADPRLEKGLRWFFKEPVDPYGIRASVLKEIVSSTYRQIKAWPTVERNAFCTELWKSGKLEEGIVVSHLYRRFRKQCGAAEFRLFESWLNRYVTNWAQCDGVSTYLLASSIENNPALVAKLPGWATSKNRWKRRAAAVSLVHEAKHGRQTKAILDIAERLREDPDDMVRKGLGWLLKEAYPAKPAAILQYIEPRRKTLPRLVLRIAGEKMPPEHRARIMAP